MLNKLMPKQIAGYWDAIKHGIKESFPPDIATDPEALNKILIQLMAGNLQCWFSTGKSSPEGKVDTFYGFIITKLDEDGLTGAHALVVYALYLYQHAPENAWIEATSKLEEFARHNKCSKIIGYTQNNKLVELSKRFNYSSNWTLLVKEL